MLFFVIKQLESLLLKCSQIFAIEPIFLNLYHNIEQFIEKFLAEHSGWPTQVDFEKQFWSWKFYFKLLSSVLSGHKIVHTWKTIWVQIVGVQMGFNWIVKFGQVILVDYFVEFFQISEVSRVLLNQFGSHRFSEPLFDLDHSILNPCKRVLHINY